MQPVPGALFVAGPVLAKGQGPRRRRRSPGPHPGRVPHVVGPQQGATRGAAGGQGGGRAVPRTAWPALSFSALSGKGHRASNQNKRPGNPGPSRPSPSLPTRVTQSQQTAIRQPRSKPAPTPEDAPGTRQQDSEESAFVRWRHERWMLSMSRLFGHLSHRQSVCHALPANGQRQGCQFARHRAPPLTPNQNSAASNQCLRRHPAPGTGAPQLGPAVSPTAAGASWAMRPVARSGGRGQRW